MKLPKAYITGLTGSIGHGLVTKLLQEGYDVTGFIRKESKRMPQVQKNFGDNPHFHIVNLSLNEYSVYALSQQKTHNRENYPKARETGRDLFFHLAWGGTFGAGRDDDVMQQHNVEYTLDAVRLANALGCSVFVGAGSQAEYGPVLHKLAPDTPEKPVTAYGRAKLMAGIESRKLCEKFHIRHQWCRILSVYGPYDTEKTMVMSSIIKLFSGIRPVYTSATQMWDYMYSADAAAALVAVAQRGIDKKVYVLGSGQAVPLSEYIYEIRDCINRDLELGIGEIPDAAGSHAVTYLCADIETLTTDTGFSPAVSFHDGIERTITWYKEEIGYEESQHYDSMLQ